MMKMLMFYDEREDKDENAYSEWQMKMLQMLNQSKQAGDVLDIAQYKNILDSPRSVDEINWTSVSAWAKFWESKEYKRAARNFDKFYKNWKVLILEGTMGTK